MNDTPYLPEHRLLDRDLSADTSKAAQIRNGLIDGVCIGADHFQVSQMAFLLAEVTVCGVELQKVDNDAATDFLRALADMLDTRRPMSARRRAQEERQDAFTTIARRARALEQAMGQGDGGVTS